MFTVYHFLLFCDIGKLWKSSVWYLFRAVLNRTSARRHSVSDTKLAILASKRCGINSVSVHVCCFPGHDLGPKDLIQTWGNFLSSGIKKKTLCLLLKYLSYKKNQTLPLWVCFQIMLLSHNERFVEDLFRAKKKRESVANVCGSSWKTKNKYEISNTLWSVLHPAKLRGPLFNLH